MALTKEKIQKIADQALTEIEFARTFKQGKIGNWQKNEEMYYGLKLKSETSRASVQLGRMQEFVHTLLSKIDNPLVFKFTKRKNSQTKRAERLNALRQIEQSNDNWDIKDIVGKKQAIIYGRAIYWYYADSVDGIYKSHLEPVDVYSFLIDPSCGGIDIEEARHLGSYSVILGKKQLKEGKKAGIYLKWAVDAILEGPGNANDTNQEVTNARPRTNDTSVIGWREPTDTGKYKFWRWLTTSEEDGERYYLLMDNSGRVIRCELLTDMFPATTEFPNGAWPIWTWAAFPDLTEFWTPSYCDYSREIFMAQDVSINQMLDNAEAINKPQKVVNVTAIENMAELKYRRDGVIKVKGDIDVNKAIQFIQTPSINTPIEVFNILENIQAKASGVTDGTAGVADEDGKVGIYEGNQAATADRFGLLNKSYSFGYKRFARLFEMGVAEHLTKRVAVDIIGPNGVEMEEINRRDIFRKGDTFGVLVEASNAQMMASKMDKEAKMTFLQAHAESDKINQTKALELEAEIVGFSEDQIEQLLDTSYYGNSELMGECDRDIEALLDGEELKPNGAANNAYKQKMVNYLRDHEENINMEQFERIANYIRLLDPIIMRNEASNLNNEVVNQMNQRTAMIGQEGAPEMAEQSTEIIAPEQSNPLIQ